MALRLEGRNEGRGARRALGQEEEKGERKGEVANSSKWLAGGRPGGRAAGRRDLCCGRTSTEHRQAERDTQTDTRNRTLSLCLPKSNLDSSRSLIQLDSTPSTPILLPVSPPTYSILPPTSTSA